MCRRKSLHAAAGDLAGAPTPRRSEAVDKLIQQWETSSPRSSQTPAFFSPIRTASPRTPPSAAGLCNSSHIFSLHLQPWPLGNPSDSMAWTAANKGQERLFLRDRRKILFCPLFAHIYNTCDNSSSCIVICVSPWAVWL